MSIVLKQTKCMSKTESTRRKVLDFILDFSINHDELRKLFKSLRAAHSLRK